MTAIVTVLNDRGIVVRTVEVPKADSYVILPETGYLQLLTARYGDPVGCFKTWDEVTIVPSRGRDGRFVRKD